MRSQSLFNFFTKAADTYKSAAAPGQNPQGDVRPQTTAKPKPAYDPAQLKKTVDSDYAAYDSMYGAGAGDTGSTRLAYSNYMSSLARAYARRSITRDEYYARRDYIRDRLATEQFDDMYNSYHTWTNRDKYGDKATDPGRMSMAMVDDTNRRRYIFKRGAGSPANMTYAQFRDNFIIDPKTGKPISKDEARLKWNSMWQRSAGPYTGNSGVPAGGSVPGSGVPQGDTASQQWDATVTAYNNNSKNAGTPLTFKGGHIVNYDPSYVEDWTRYTKNNPANNNVGGTWYNNEQYLSYHDISDQLYNSMINSGMNPNKAKAEASRLTKAYLDDQMEIARGGTARNQWMEQPSASGTPAATTGKSNVTTKQPSAPAADPAVNNASTTVPTNGKLVTLGGDPVVVPEVGGDNLVTPAGDSTLTYDTLLPVNGSGSPQDALTIGGNNTVTPTVGSMTTGDTHLPLGGGGSPQGALTVGNKYTPYEIRFNGNKAVDLYSPENTGMGVAINPTLPNRGVSTIPSGDRANTGGDTVLNGLGNSAVTPTVEERGEGQGKDNITYKPAPKYVQGQEDSSITGYDLASGVKNPTDYIKYYTQSIDNDYVRENYGNNLSWGRHQDIIGGRHYNNMQNLYALAKELQKDPQRSADLQKVMASLYNEARKYNYYAERRGFFSEGTTYTPSLEQQHPAFVDKTSTPGELRWYENDYIPEEIETFIDNYYG